MNLFGKERKKPTAKEVAKNASRETKKEVRGAQRDIDRELRDLERQEKQVIAEIKSRARSPNINPQTDTTLKTLAKHLVTIRQQRTKLIDARAHLGAVGMHATSMATQAAAAQAVSKVTDAMGAANSAVDAKEMQKVMNEFMKQNEIMNVREELMDDALVDAFDSEELDEEAEQITNQVLAELGLEMANKMDYAPSAKLPANAQQETDALPDLRARLDAL